MKGLRESLDFNITAEAHRWQNVTVAGRRNSSYFFEDHGDSLALLVKVALGTLGASSMVEISEHLQQHLKHAVYVSEPWKGLNQLIAKFCHIVTAFCCTEEARQKENSICDSIYMKLKKRHI